MKNIYKLFLKTFVLTGGIFASIMFLMGLMIGESFTLKRTLFLFLSFGGMLAILTTIFHFKRIQKAGLSDIEESDLNINQTKIISSKLSFSDIITAIEKQKKIVKSVVEKDTKTIILKTGFSVRSWGEQIRIDYLSKNEDVFEYRVSSSPIVKMTSVDYGKNRENIDLLESILSNNS